MKVNMLMGSLVLGASLCTPSFGGGLLDRMLGMRGAGCDSVCCDTGCAAAAPSCGCEISAPACDSGCAPACGGGLLSRLKGRLCDNGCAAPSCGCEIADPSCGCEIAPACGDACGAAPSCGCEIAPACGDACGAAPSCGCEIASGDPCGCDSGCKPRRRPLMELLGKAKCTLGKIGSHRASCDSGCADPSCGCEIAAPVCDTGCGAAPSCGCEIAACDPCAAPSCGRSCGGLLSKLFQRKNRGCDTMVCDSGCASGCSSCGSGSVSYPSSAPVAAPAIRGDAAPMPPAPIVDPSAYLQSNRRVIQATSYVR
jgi:hypothetical protein